eukprot:6465853-Amphidinium_carterae.1
MAPKTMHTVQLTPDFIEVSAERPYSQGARNTNWLAGLSASPPTSLRQVGAVLAMAVAQCLVARCGTTVTCEDAHAVAAGLGGQRG